MEYFLMWVVAKCSTAPEMGQKDWVYGVKEAFPGLKLHNCQSLYSFSKSHSRDFIMDHLKELSTSLSHWCIAVKGRDGQMHLLIISQLTLWFGDYYLVKLYL